MPHFIYCGIHYAVRDRREQLQEIILKNMKKYGIQSSVLTLMVTWRNCLMTKEKVQKAYEGKLKNDKNWNFYEGSINDDLERFWINLQNETEVKNEYVKSFFTPKLTDEELKLVLEENEEHFKTYYFKDDADVDAEEMKKSSSTSKYVHGTCLRHTFVLKMKQTKPKIKFHIYGQEKKTFDA